LNLPPKIPRILKTCPRKLPEFFKLVPEFWDSRVEALPKADQNCPETRIALLGNKDAGKSTLIHVLLKGMLDDGHGSRCKNILEKKSPCKYLSYWKPKRPNTFSINSVILGFDQEVSFLRKFKSVKSLKVENCKYLRKVRSEIIHIS